MIVLAVDPGTRKTGIAVVGLASCVVRVVPGDAAPAEALQLALDFDSHGAGLAHVVIEVPIFRSFDRSLGSPNDLITLALLAGRIAGAVGTVHDVEEVAPHVWKGVVPKDVHQARVRRRIEANHAAWLSTWDGTDHNGRDAIALAMWRGGLLA